MRAISLTIAGSDPSGGAGIQADLKTFHQLGVYGEAVITMLTVQNTRRVSKVESLAASLVAEQIAAVLEDLPPHAAKTGALGNEAIIEAVASFEWACPLVIDPVMISKHGASLMGPEARRELLRWLFPKAALITPNLPEAAELTGIEVNTVAQMREAALRLSQATPAAILVKGGHLNDTRESSDAPAPGAVDILYYRGQFEEFESPRIETRHTHGTGCTYSAAITAFLARGFEIPEAVARAKRFITEAIRTAPGLGGGSGPVNHWAGGGGDSL